MTSVLDGYIVKKVSLPKQHQTECFGADWKSGTPGERSASRLVCCGFALGRSRWQRIVQLFLLMCYYETQSTI